MSTMTAYTAELLDNGVRRVEGMRPRALFTNYAPPARTGTGTERDLSSSVLMPSPNLPTHPPSTPQRSPAESSAENTPKGDSPALLRPPLPKPLAAEFAYDNIECQGFLEYFFGDNSKNSLDLLQNPETIEWVKNVTLGPSSFSRLSSGRAMCTRLINNGDWDKQFWRRLCTSIRGHTTTFVRPGFDTGDQIRRLDQYVVEAKERAEFDESTDVYALQSKFFVLFSGIRLLT